MSLPPDAAQEPVPPDFAARGGIEKAFYDLGWRIPNPPAADGPWLVAGSTTAPGRVRAAALDPLASRAYAFATDSHAVTAALAAEFALRTVAGRTAFVGDLGALHRLANRAYHLSRALPTVPLDAFRADLRDAGQNPDTPPATEAERLVRQRIGQDRFRAALLDDWGRCPLTGIAEPELLRASHIVPWSACQSDEERLDVHNGLLLSALWDAAFDRGLVTFADDGTARFSAALSAEARTALGSPAPLRLRPPHLPRLAFHRTHVFKD